MEQKDIHLITDDSIDFLVKNPDSFLYKIIEGPVPSSDDEYISMWANYYSFISDRKDFGKNIINNLNYERLAKSMLKVEYLIYGRIKKIIQENVQSKSEKIDFEPRIDIYLNSFPEHERESIKKLLVHLIDDKYNQPFKGHIIGMADSLEIDRKWVMGLHEEHRLITDDILEFGSLSIDEGKSILEKDVGINIIVKKIFLGSELSETELYQIKHSPLVEMFELADSELLDELSEENESEDFNLFSHGEEDDLDVETMIASLELDRIENTEQHLDSHDEEVKDDKSHDDITDVNDNERDVSPYTSDLDYLEQEFIWLKTKSELAEKRNDTFRIDINGDERKIKELEQKTKKLKDLCELRLRKSIKNGFTPRMIALQKKYRLSEPELNTIKSIITEKLFPAQQSFGHKGNTVGSILILLFDDIKERVRALKMFQKKSKLVRSGVIQLDRSSFDQDLFHCTVQIDTRMVQYLRGEDFDISDYIDGGFLYDSAITLDDTILPKEEKQQLLLKVDYYPTVVNTKNKIEMPSHVEYGDAQVNLFVGPSGTGKTMLANALANHLDKKILLFNLNNYSNINYFNEPDKNLFSLLFREARMNDAILFFDESESLLSNRINDLLIELEKHHGIVIFATNASFTIDDALRRRINHIVYFKDPGPKLRKKIWEVHLPKKIKVSEDIDLDKLALRFEINGGLIKNAVFSAIAHAVADSAEDEVELRMKHLEMGADEQLRNKLFMSKMEKQISPSKSFQDLILPEQTSQTLQKIAGFEKSRKVLVGEWGFKDKFDKMTGKVVLFHGPSGTGKTLAAEALAYETGKNLKMPNYSEIMSKWVGETEKALEALMQEVAEANSILLFDEADGLFASRTEISSVNDRYANMITNVLLKLTENFNSIAVLTTNFLQNIDPAFYRRMELVEFKMPDKKLRHELWQYLIPPKLPLADDVDLSVLADTFRFSGGEIKNAIIEAASAKANLMNGPRVVDMNDFVTACNAIKDSKLSNRNEIGFLSD